MHRQPLQSLPIIHPMQLGILRRNISMKAFYITIKQNYILFSLKYLSFKSLPTLFQITIKQNYFFLQISLSLQFIPRSSLISENPVQFNTCDNSWFLREDGLEKKNTCIVSPWEPFLILLKLFAQNAHKKYLLSILFSILLCNSDQTRVRICIDLARWWPYLYKESH